MTDAIARFSSRLQAGTAAALLLGLVTLSLSAAAFAESFEIQSGHSAMWYNPDRDGEGWMLEVLDKARANLYWFTYDDAGHQRWLTAMGEIDGARIVFPELLVTHGGRFGSDFDPEAVVHQPAGELIMTFEDCDNGKVSFQVFGQTGTIAIERFSSTMATTCAGDTSERVQPQAALSGSWFDPARSGQGLGLQWLEDDTALLTWFTYNNQGHQQWMIGVGTLDDDDRLVFPELHTARGARFGAGFKPEDVEREEWGSLVLDLDCAGGEFEYQSVLPEFGNGTQESRRLTELAGLECATFMPARAALEDADWDARFNVAGLSGSWKVPLPFMLLPAVYDLGPMADGSILAAGSFRWLGQDRVPPLVQGAVQNDDWQALPQAAHLSAVAATAVATDPVAPLAMAVTWPGRILIDDGDDLHEIGSYSGQVRRLAWFEGELWAAGRFELVDGGPADLAVWDGETWQAPLGGAADGAVQSLHVSDEGLYVGGDFEQVGGIETGSVALFDGLGWQGFDSPGHVHAIASTPNGLFAAGAFFGVKRWDGSDWQALGAGLASNAGGVVVTDIEFFQDKLYAVGCFQFANGDEDASDAVRARGIARWNGQAWQTLDDFSSTVRPFFERATLGFIECPNAPEPDRETRIQRLASAGDHLYVGGHFAGIDGRPSQGLIAYDGEAFVAIGAAGLGLSGAADALAPAPDGTLYAFGATHFGGSAAPARMARFDTDHGWALVDAPLPPFLMCSSAHKRMAVDRHGRLFLGCTDHSADPGRQDPSLWKPRVIYLEDGAWQDIENVGDFPPLQVLTRDSQGNIWIGGGRHSVSGGEGYIARLEGGQFEVFEDRFDSFVSHLAFAPTASGQQGFSLIAGGPFSKLGEEEYESIAHWQGHQWQPLEGLEHNPAAIEYGRGQILVSTSSGGDNEDNLTLGAWDGEAWVELATPENGFPDFGDSRPHFSLIRQAGERVFLVGNLPDDSPGQGQPYVFESGSFGRLAGGLGGKAPSAIAVTSDAVFLGGTFVEADPDEQPLTSMGIARLAWPTIAPK